LPKENIRAASLYNRLMGRGTQGQGGDAFSKILGTRRGALGNLRYEDAFVMGHSSFEPHLKEILKDIEESGDRTEAMALFDAHFSRLALDNPHVRAMISALAKQGVREEIRNWEPAVLYEATVLRTTKRKGGRSTGLALYAKKTWARAAQAEAVEAMMLDVKRRRHVQPAAALSEGCRVGMAVAFAEQCHHEGIEGVERVAGPQSELERALGTWPPKRGLDSFWGLGDWQHLLAGFISKRDIDKAVDESPDGDVSASAHRARKGVAQDLRSALRQAERRGSPRELFILT